MWKFIEFLRKPFIWGICAAIYFAYLFPEVGIKGGLLKPEITVKFFAIGIIFFISGLTLKTEDLSNAVLRHFHIHLFIQLYTFLFIPFIVQFFVLVLSQFYPSSDLLLGFITLSCMPPPVSSAVLLTKKAEGNEAAAVFNSALGSFLGIMVTPALLFTLLNVPAEVPILSSVIHIICTIVIPVIVGQYMQKFIAILQYKQLLSAIGSFMLLLIIYTAFCETFTKSDSNFTVSTVAITCSAVVLLQLILMGIAFLITSTFTSRFTPNDIIAILFCATHKSLTLGFPLLKILYGSEPQFVVITFPLLVYHPSQILLGSLMLPALQMWKSKVIKMYKTGFYSV